LRTSSFPEDARCLCYYLIVFFFQDSESFRLLEPGVGGGSSSGPLDGRFSWTPLESPHAVSPPMSLPPLFLSREHCLQKVPLSVGGAGSLLEMAVPLNAFVLSLFSLKTCMPDGSSGADASCGAKEFFGWLCIPYDCVLSPSVESLVCLRIRLLAEFFPSLATFLSGFPVE